MALTSEERAQLLGVIPILEKLAAEQHESIVPTADDLQAALDAAQPGDILRVPDGAVWIGRWTLGPKTDYVTLRGHAILKSPDHMPVLSTAPKASYWRIEGLTFQVSDPSSDILRIGEGAQTLEDVPHHFIFDEVNVEGDPVLGQKRGLAANGAVITVVNSTFTNMKRVAQDSQAICAWNGPGPFHIEGNYLEAAGEVILFGGADSRAPELMPRDITIHNNEITRPVEWRGRDWTFKNLIELKVGINVAITNNRFSNHWSSPHAPDGHFAWFKSVNQDGTAPWSEVRNVRFERNTVTDVASGFSLLAQQNGGVPMSDVKIVNNHFTISRAQWGGTRAYFAILQGVADVTFDRNTVINDGDVTLSFDSAVSPRLKVTGNILYDHWLGIKGAGTGEGVTTLNAWAPQWEMTGNLIVTASAWLYPSGNRFEATLPADTTGYGAQ